MFSETYMMDHLIVEQDETIKEDRGSEIPTTSQSQRVDISRIQSAYSDRCHSRSNFPLVLDEYGEEKDPRVSINRIFSWILCFHFCCQRICQLDKWKSSLSFNDTDSMFMFIKLFKVDHIFL